MENEFEYQDSMFEFIQWHHVHVNVYQPQTHSHWLNSNTTGEWAVYLMDYYFESEADAVHFALKWT